MQLATCTEPNLYNILLYIIAISTKTLCGIETTSSRDTGYGCSWLYQLCLTKYVPSGHTGFFLAACHIWLPENLHKRDL